MGGGNAGVLLAVQELLLHTEHLGAVGWEGLGLDGTQSWGRGAWRAGN